MYPTGREFFILATIIAIARKSKLGSCKKPPGTEFRRLATSIAEARKSKLGSCKKPLKVPIAH